MKRQRAKRSPEEYEELIRKAMQTGNAGWAEYLSHRFDRDYQPTEEPA